MNIVIDSTIIERYVSTLDRYDTLLKSAVARIEELKKETDADRMLTAEQARAYLGGVSEDTMLYYRKHGLDYYKKGRDGIWYRKGDIDAWLQTGRVNRHQIGQS